MAAPLRRPHSVLFACTMNRVRSPMAAALLERRLGAEVFVDSCGVLASCGGSGGEAGVGEGEGVDSFVREALAEAAITAPTRRPKSFSEVGPDQFDLIICLTADAAGAAASAVRGCAVDLEVWKTPDPTLEEGSRLQRLEAYRRLLLYLSQKIADRFPL